MYTPKETRQFNIDSVERVRRYAAIIQKQCGKAVRPYHADGYVNMANKYGTSKDPSTQYFFQGEDDVPDDVLASFYSDNGLFAKIIDAPAEESVKHGFELDGIEDQDVKDFATEALDELDWEETAMTCIKWARLFGGAVAVMLINDGRGLEEPLDWSNIQSIDDIRIYDRSLIQPDYSSMYSYDPDDPFRTRGSRLGMPEYYRITSKYGSFVVHDSRCLVFQNGTLPERTTHSVYEMWGTPEYIKLKDAIQDVYLAHRSAPKMLDKSIQAIYKMKNLAQELATEEGEDRVVKRLQVIDLARSMLSSIAIDAEGEDYDFRTFQLAGVSEIIDSSCNLLSAISCIPQTILFGRSPAGMNATGESDFENWYNYNERIQKRMLKPNLRYLLSVIFQAGQATGEIKEIPPINVKFNPLWSLSETEQVALDQQKAAVQATKAQTAAAYVEMQAIDPTEVRKKLADSEEFDVENMLDDYDEEELFENMPQDQGQAPAEGGPAQGTERQPTPDDASEAAPDATKLPQDMPSQDAQKAHKADNADITKSPTETANRGSVGVLVISDGLILCGTRKADTGSGLICGPGGHIEKGELPEYAAIREANEEFGIIPKELIPLGSGPKESDTGLKPHIFLCTDYEGTPCCDDDEMCNPNFHSIEELADRKAELFKPFADSLTLLRDTLTGGIATDGGSGSGNWGHEGRPGEIGGSSPSSGGSDAHASWKKKCDEKREEFKAQDDSQKGFALTKLYGAKNGDPVFDRIVTAFQEGRIDEEVDKYFDLLEANGDPEPTKPMSGQLKTDEIVESGYGGDWAAMRKGEMEKATGFSGEKSDKTIDALNTWVSNEWSKADSDALDDYVSAAPAYDGKMYRGLHFEPGDGKYESFMSGIEPGSTLKMNGPASWAGNEENARFFAHTVDDTYDSVLVRCISNRTSAPIGYINQMGEDEILSSSQASWTVLSVEQDERSSGGRKAIITVIEKGE